MDANEKKMLDALAASAAEVDVPASLAPESVRARLEALEETPGEPSAAVRAAARRAPRRRRWAPAAVAASLVLLAGVGLFAAGMAGLPGQGEPAGGNGGAATAKVYCPAPPEVVEAAGEDADAVTPVPTADSYAQLYRLVNAAGGYGDDLDGAEAAAAEDGAVRGETMKDADDTATVTEASMAADASASTGASGDFSQTNLRTAGVDEADVVKTDGKVIYVLQRSEGQVTLVKAKDGKMKKAAVIKAKDLFPKKSEYADFCEMFVADDRLYLVASIYNDEFAGNTITRLVTFDVSDPAKPKQVADVQQAGYYNSARMTGGYLYLFTDFYPSLGGKQDAVERYVPTVDGEALACEDVYVPSCTSGDDYLVVGSVKTSDPGKLLQTKAVLSGASRVYVSTDSIYLYGPKRPAGDMKDFGVIGEEVAETTSAEAVTTDSAMAEPEPEADTDTAKKVEPVPENPEDEAPVADDDAAVAVSTDDVAFSLADVAYFSDSTVICKLSFGEGKVEPVGETTVEGLVDSGFSIDEYEGNTRVITTSFTGDEQSSNVFVLDAGLKKIGELTDLAPGERVYSARLMGPIGYFVTYREVDPLFSVDFSDPTAPKVIGKLKIPGFSEYLHPWGEGKLLGIGMATATTGKGDDAVTVTDGVKLSMFDTSDPANVRELHTFVLKDTYWGAALDDHRAVYADAERGLVGFAAEGEYAVYYLFSYGKDGFSEKLDDRLKGWDSFDARGVRIGDVFYVVGAERVDSYRLDGYKKVDGLEI